MYHVFTATMYTTAMLLSKLRQKKVTTLGVIYCDAGIDTDCDENTAPLLILEYMPFGNLQSFLENHRYVCKNM